MSMGDSGLFKGTAGARAAEIDAPIGFDEMPPDPQEKDIHAFSCYDHVPRIIVPPLTNGGRIRSMDNHQLAAWMADLAAGNAEQETGGQWGQREFFNWLSEPANESRIRR